MIQLVELNKYFEEKHVLKNINASFLPGVANLVIGASGGGKSVMVKTMVGLEKPSGGQVLFEGQDYYNLEYEQHPKFCAGKLGCCFRAPRCLIHSRLNRM